MAIATQWVLSSKWISTDDIIEVDTKSNKPLIFQNTFTGWKNRQINICTIKGHPLISSNDNSPIVNKTLDQVNGLIPDILRYLSKELDFIPIISNSIDGKFGGPVKDSQYFSGCIGELQNGTTDLGASYFSLTEERAQVIDFLFPLIEIPIVATINSPPKTDNPWSLLMPLQPIVWILVISSIFLGGLTSYLMARLSPLSAWNLQLNFRIADEVELQSNLWNIVGSFLQQGQDFYPYAMSSRTVLVFWWFFTVIIFGTYTADLTSYLTVGSNTNRIKDLEELSKQTNIRPYLPDGEFIEAAFRTTPGDIFRRLYDIKSKLALDDQHCIEYVIEKNVFDVACFHSSLYSILNMKKSCRNLYLLPDNLFPVPMGFIVAQNSPFKDRLNFYIKKLTETGLFQRFVHNHFGTDGLVLNCTVKQESDSIALGDITGSLWIVMALYLFGFVFLIFEIFWTRVLKRPTRDLL